MNSAGFSVASTSNPRCAAICAIATVPCGMHSVCRNAAVSEKMSALKRLFLPCLTAALSALPRGLSALADVSGTSRATTSAASSVPRSSDVTGDPSLGIRKLVVLRTYPVASRSHAPSAWPRRIGPHGDSGSAGHGRIVVRGQARGGGSLPRLR